MRVVLSLSMLFLLGCEAPLVLDQVEERRRQPIHRMDRFQAAAVHDSNIVVVGNQGVILHSTDDGATWRRNELAGWPSLIDVTACADGTFVALAFEQKVYVSTDTGASWQERPIPTTETPQALTCTTEGKLWVVGSFTFIWSSTDFGANWSEQTRDEDAILTTVQFFDADNAIITGEFGVVLKTTDGGATWEAVEPLTDEYYPQAAYFADPQTGWVIGLGGTVWKTVDGARTWNAEETGTQVSLYGIEPVGDGLYIVGGEGTILAYNGVSWEPVAHGKPIRLYVRAIVALGTGRYLVAGVAGALHIIDVSDA